ncbi:hypothetical protein GF325_19125 [Candidatus Bathyarchaeota archaeon]|nr:hypothetical protein [Candidatus Bathyarchaeota archaeon]
MKDDRITKHLDALKRMGRKTCDICGNKVPFWFVICPKCNQGFQSSKQPTTTIIKLGKIIKVIARIHQAKDDFRLFHEVMLYFSVDNGISWKQSAMKPAKDAYIVEIAGIPNGATILYYIEAKDIAGKILVEDNNGKHFTFNVE